MKPARVSIDCSPLLVRSAGVKTYLYHWTTALRALYPDSIQTFLDPRGETLDHRGGGRIHPMRMAALMLLRRLPPRLASLLVPSCEIFHTSNLLGSHLPAAIGRRALLSTTVHDMTAWTVPSCHITSQVTADKEFAECVFRRADGLIAVSEHTRLDAVRLLGLRPESLQVIYPGVSDSYFAVTEAEATAAAEVCSLTLPYFLFVGTIEPRKNIDTLLDAWMSLPACFRRESELVLTGMPGWKAEHVERRLKQLTNDRSGVRYMGYLPEPLLPGLIAGALALVCPSYYEGFGFPVAQAMAAGCPVIASNVSSLPEITSGSAVLVDPRSSREIADAMRRVRESPSLREELRALGRKRSALFNWRESARSSFRFFTELRR